MDNPPSRTTTSRWQGLRLALGLSGLLLLVTSFTFVETLAFMFDRHQILRGFEWLPLVVSPSGLLLMAFAAYVVVGHVLFALVALWVARSWHRRAGASAGPLHRYILAAWLLWAAALLFANAGLSPWSDAARNLRSLAQARLGPVEAWQVMVALALLSLAPAVAALFQRVRTLRSDRRLLFAAGGTALLGLGLVIATLAPAAPAPAARKADRPNVIIIGVDSLRLPWVGAFGGQDTPNMDRFLEDAMLFEWSFTPVARTFGAWMSILTGQNPRTSGVRDNVWPPETYAGAVTLADDFQSAGWRTVFAMDERRFAYIDEEFGFDQAIGPPIGAHDFLIATIADLPIANVFANTPVGRYLLPTLHANRTAAVSYEPATFDAMIWRELETDDKPLFLAVHFTLPHHPVFWASASREVTVTTRPDVPVRALMHEQLLRAATREADAQVGRFLAEAERRGLLDNAIVVLMSDHGEANGLPEEDNLYNLHAPRGVAGLNFSNSVVGHGNSVTSSRQFESLISFRRYGNGERWVGRNGLQASLIDLAPTLTSLAGVRLTNHSDGIDLSPVLRGAEPSRAMFERILFTETGFSPFTIANEPDFDERRVFLESIAYYHVDYARGRITFRPDQVAQMIKLKERAAIASPWVLAVVPSLTTDSTLWIIYNMANGDWVRYPQDLDLLPGKAPAALMERSLLEHYGEELSPPQPWPESLTVYEGQPLPPAFTPIPSH